jgi:hypothetical protein
MGIPPIAVVLVWMLVCVGTVAALVIQVVRHRIAKIGWALLCPLGAMLAFGLVSASIGAAEGVWSATGTGAAKFWLAMGIGLVGLLLQTIGWRVVLRTRLAAHQCQRCGYELGTLSQCPECGFPGRHPRG